MATTRSCNMCHEPAELLCQRCRDPYCSNKCQINDWPQHKLTCFPMPCLIRPVDSEAVLLQKLQTELNASLSTRPTISTAPLRKPKITATFESPEKSPVTNDEELKKTGSMFDNPFKKNSYYPAFQTNESLKSQEDSPVKNEALKIHCIAATDGFRKVEYVGEANVPKPQANGAMQKSEIVVENHKSQVEVARKPVANVQTSPKPQGNVVTRKLENMVQTFPKPQANIAVKKPQVVVQTISKPHVNVEQARIPAAKREAVKEQVIQTPLIKHQSDSSSSVIRSIAKPIETDPPAKHTNASKSSTLAEPWTKPFAIEGEGFVSVVVLYAAEECTNNVWVMLKKNEEESNNLLRDINKNISAAPNVKMSQIKVGELYVVPFEEIYYRAVILETHTSLATVVVRLIDYGNEVDVPINELKTAPSTLRNMNAFAFQIKFQTPRKVALEDTLNVQIKAIKNDAINVIVEGERSFPVMGDLEIVPIPTGVETNLYCLDYSNLIKGYISACVYDIRAIGGIEEIGSKISAYCVQNDEAYQPSVGELCLVIFDDGEWYRAVTRKAIDSNTFGIMFIDYGNITTVSASNIRKMPEEFMHHCLTNICFLDGAPKKPSNEEVAKMTNYFQENQIFTIESATKEKNVYLITVPKLKF